MAIIGRDVKVLPKGHPLAPEGEVIVTELDGTTKQWSEVSRRPLAAVEAEKAQAHRAAIDAARQARGLPALKARGPK